MIDAEAEHRLKLEQMEMDIQLKRRQIVWESPRNIAILAATIAAIAGTLGFKLGQQPQQAQFPTHITVELQQPGAVK